jgi:hypothetical protein
MLALLQQQLLLGGKKEKTGRKVATHNARFSLPKQFLFSSLLFSAAALCKEGNGEAIGWVSAGTKTQARSSSCCYFCTVGKERNPQSSASTSASEDGYPRPLLSSQGEKIKWKPPQTW